MSLSLKPMDGIVVLTGAGISAESGIKTFRDQNGLWENHRIEDVASPEGFSRSPNLVHEFYNLRRRQLKEASVQPNLAHLALAKLEREWQGPFTLITQNVDNLHQRAGSKNVLPMHGELNKILCTACDKHFEWTEDLSPITQCPSCHTEQTLRPDIVWFGEMPYHMTENLESLSKCKLFVSIGTSGLVYPAADFARIAQRAYRIEINLQTTPISKVFHESRLGLASSETEILVNEILTKMI